VHGSGGGAETLGDKESPSQTPDAILPFKLNQDRRHHISRQQHKVTNSLGALLRNWPAYDASLRERGSLMGQSSGCFEARLKGRPGLNDSPEHVHAASCEGDDGLVAAFPLASFAVVEGAAVVVVERAERGLVEHTLETPVAAVRPAQEARLAGLAQHRRDPRITSVRRVAPGRTVRAHTGGTTSVQRNVGVRSKNEERPGCSTLKQSMLLSTAGGHRRLA